MSIDLQAGLQTDLQADLQADLQCCVEKIAENWLAVSLLMKGVVAARYGRVYDECGIRNVESTNEASAKASLLVFAEQGGEKESVAFLTGS